MLAPDGVLVNPEDMFGPDKAFGIGTETKVRLAFKVMKLVIKISFDRALHDITYLGTLLQN